MNCKICDKVLGRKNKSGYCHAHANSNPEKRAKISASLKRSNQLNPGRVADRLQKQRETCSTDEWRQRNRELCIERKLWEKGFASLKPEHYIQAGKTFHIRHGRGSWCPPEYIEEAKRLQRKNIPLEEIKSMIADLITADFRKKIAKKEAA